MIQMNTLPCDPDVVVHINMCDMLPRVNEPTPIDGIDAVHDIVAAIACDRMTRRRQRG